MIKKFALLAATAMAVSVQPAMAQDSGDGTRVRVGVGAQYRPEFVGADDNEFAPLLDVSVKRGPGPFDFGAPDDSFDIKLYNRNGFSLGPVANYQPGRKNKDVGAPVGKVSGTIEVGGFLQYYATESTRLRLEVRQGLGGHKGLVASLGADQIWRDGDNWDFSIGPRVLFSSSKYADAWFGVDQSASLASGLPQFDADGGIHSVGVTSGGHYALGGAFGLFGYARYERLVGDGADSPIVRKYGSKGQASAGLGVTYTFNMN